MKSKPEKHIRQLEQENARLQEELGNANRVASDYKKVYEQEFKDHKAQTEMVIKLRSQLADKIAEVEKLNAELCQQKQAVLTVMHERAEILKGLQAIAKQPKVVTD